MAMEYLLLSEWMVYDLLISSIIFSALPRSACWQINTCGFCCRLWGWGQTSIYWPALPTSLYVEISLIDEHSLKQAIIHATRPFHKIVRIIQFDIEGKPSLFTLVIILLSVLDTCHTFLKCAVFIFPVLFLRWVKVSKSARFSVYLRTPSLPFSCRQEPSPPFRLL